MAEISVVPPIPSTALQPGPAVPGETDLHRVSRAFEAAFLSEMLRHTGVGRMPESFGGGAGEAGFADMLTREYAEEIARSGKLGLAERIRQDLAGQDLAGGER